MQILSSAVGFAIAMALSAGAHGAAQNASAPRAVLELAGGAVTTRPLEGLAVERLSELPAAFVRFEGLAPLAAAPGAARDLAEVRLLDGDWLRARVAGGAGDELELELPDGQRLRVDVDVLVSIVFPGRISAGQRGSLHAPERGDRLLWLRSGGLDRVDGTLEAFPAGGPRFESVLGSREFPWSDVAALYVEPLGETGAKTPRDSCRRVSVDLAAGGRLHGELKRLAADGVQLADVAGRELTLPLAAVAEIALDDGSLSFLSEVPPSRAVEGWPEGDDLGMRWRYQIDRAVVGEPLRAGGLTWRRGIGVHAPSRLEWTLDGSWRALRGAVAVDDSVLLLASRGSVEFRVFVDGAAEPTWKSGLVRGGDAPLTLPPISLTGAKQLALEVSMEGDLYVADRADWLRVVLLR